MDNRSSMDNGSSMNNTGRMNNRGSMDNRGSMCNMCGFNCFTSCLWYFVLYWGAGDLGDGVTVLHFHRDQLHLGVVNAVLSGDLTASMLHSCLNRVSYSVGYRGCNVMNKVNRSREWSMSNISTVVGICFSICLCLPFVKSVVSLRSITDSVHYLLAQLLVLDLLRVHGLLVANILSCGGAGLCYENHVCYFAIRCRYR